MTESPYDLSPQIQAYYSGWDKQTTYGETVCIHHPQSNPKDIATGGQPSSGGSGGYFWKVVFQPTPNGNSILYGGSSGAPLYNNNGRVIGQHQGSYDYNCEAQACLFGKIGVSWDNGNTDPRRRLKDWLDPINSNVSYLDGTYCTSNEYIRDVNFQSDLVFYGCSITMQNVIVSNGADVTFNAANTTVINGEFEVELGSTVEVK